MLVLDRRVGMYIPATRQKVADALALRLASELGGVTAFRGAGGYVMADGRLVNEVVNFVFAQYNDTADSIGLAHIVGWASADLFLAGEESVGIDLDGTLVLLFANEFDLNRPIGLALRIADRLLSEAWR
jgi:hypothetical protein